MINELLSKYKDQKPKTFGENHIERSYPVSAVIAMLEEQAKQLHQPLVSGRSEQFYCTCSRAKGLDHDEDGMPYCIECQKPVQ